MKRLFKYIKAAFWVKEKVPLLGFVPVNVLALLAVTALGFGHPGFWLMGLIGEITFLWIMAGSRRFRNLVDANLLWSRNQHNRSEQEELLSRLTPPNRARYESLSQKYASVEQNYQRSHAGEKFYAENLENLQTLKGVYLRLLATSQQLEVEDLNVKTDNILDRISELDRELKDPSLTHGARDSREQTRTLLEKRIGVLQNREKSLDEIRSDLEQIETQFQLSVDSSALNAPLTREKLDMDLARNMIATPGYSAFAMEGEEYDPLLDLVEESDSVMES